MKEVYKDLLVPALTLGVNVPSSRFRVRQLKPYLEKSGIYIIEFPANAGSYPPSGVMKRLAWLPRVILEGVFRVLKANKSSGVILLQRPLVSTLLTAEILLNKPFIFDVDDAIFLSKREWSVRWIAKRASHIICGNVYLESYFSNFSKTTIIPTAVDVNYFTPAKLSCKDKIIGWSGSSSGFKFLYAIEPALIKVLEKFPGSYIKIVSDIAPSFRNIPSELVKFKKWTSDSEVIDIQNFTVGLMPLTDDKKSKGKCSFKMLTYMAVGVPVVVSPVGMNVDVMMKGEFGRFASQESEWVDAISEFLFCSTKAREYGRAGRKVAVANYSAEAVSKKLAEVIRSVQKKSGDLSL
jgi:glycosyltransferase involved in cell wall biosynthesis